MDLIKLHREQSNRILKFRKQNKKKFTPPLVIDNDNDVMISIQMLKKIQSGKTVETGLQPMLDQLGLLIQPHIIDPDARFHSHDFVEIVYVHHGTCTNHIKTEHGIKKISLNQGDICMLNSNAVHVIQDDKESNVVYNIMLLPSLLEDIGMKIITANSLEYELFFQALHSQKERESYMYFKKTDDRQNRSLVEDLICEYFDSRECRTIMLKNLMACFMVDLVRKFNVQQDELNKHELKNREIARILQYIYDSNGNVSVADLAEQFNYHKNYLSQLIKNRTGRSFSAIISEIRMERAKYYLESTALPIQSIMKHVGCSNPTWFYKKFHKQYGMTPRECRESMK